jgi:hypothetical protein
VRPRRTIAAAAVLGVVAVAAAVALVRTSSDAGAPHAPDPRPRPSDGFDRADAPSLGSMPNGWRWHEDARSTWGVEDGRARVVEGPENGFATAWVDTGHRGDVAVSARIALSPTPGRANAGLVLRYADADNHLWTKIELTEGHPGGMISIGKVSRGKLTSLLSHADGIGLRAGRTYRLEVRIDGRVVTSTVRGPGLDGPASTAYTLTRTEATAFADNRGAGLRTKLAFDEDDGGSRWDDFVVTPG